MNDLRFALDSKRASAPVMFDFASAAAPGSTGLEAERFENVVDAAFVKLRDEIEGPVAGVLLVTVTFVR